MKLSHLDLLISPNPFPNNSFLVQLPEIKRKEGPSLETSQDFFSDPSDENLFGVYLPDMSTRYSETRGLLLNRGKNNSK